MFEVVTYIERFREKKACARSHGQVEVGVRLIIHQFLNNQA